MSNSFYITTTLPYVNSDPHIGFALEIVHADIIARFQEALGKEVFFNTGTDEHGQKIFQKAQELGRDPQEYVDEYAEKFRLLKEKLHLFNGLHFIRTTNATHKLAAQEFWKRCAANGDIYKQMYKIKYCVGCELEKTDSDLADGKCPIHPNLEIQLIEEENYFFRFSKYQQPLLGFYQKNPNFVVPDFRFNEIKKFVEGGLTDFSVSRLKEKMSWGVPVPDDDTQVMYVWFDALINYVSTLGWPDEADLSDEALAKLDKSANYTERSSPIHGLFEKFWGTKENPNAIQIAGKDNLRQQSAMWQAMLMSAGLPNSRQIIIHGFINSGGQKMSKSLGNVIDPYEVVNKYGVDALRYWLAREMNTFEDGDFTWEKFKESYNANLANGLGNLVSRVMKMAVTNKVVFDVSRALHPWEQQPVGQEIKKLLEKYQIQQAMDHIWRLISWTDTFIQKQEPFKTIKTNPEKAIEDIKRLLTQLWTIANLLAPFLPETSAKIVAVIKNPTLENIPRLFPRIE